MVKRVLLEQTPDLVSNTMDIIRAQKMEFWLGPSVDIQWWPSLSLSDEGPEGSTAAGNRTLPVQFTLKLFLFLSFSNKILHLNGYIFLVMVSYKTHESKRVRNVGSKWPCQCLAQSELVSTRCVFVHGVMVRSVCQVHMLPVTARMGKG